MLSVRIHRGAHEVGGSCIELDADGARLVLDLGRPMWARPGIEVPLPGVKGLGEGDDPSLLGLVISHPHMDHYGLADQAHSSVPVYIGEAAARILKEAAFFMSGGVEFAPAGFLEHRVPFGIGPFRITPFLNDHSAFDAYSMLIEAGGRRVFYTGDLRAHGRKARLFEELVLDPPRDVDVVLMEGTHIRPGTEVRLEPPTTERDVEDACVATFRATRGMVLACFSPQNVDRLVTIYRAALRSGRDLVVDLYAAAIAAATKRETIPQADWDRVRVYLPDAQRRRVIAERAFARTDAVKQRRIYPQELAARAGELVMLFRGSMARELERARCLAGAGGVWSMWPGYLKDGSGERLRAWLHAKGIPLAVHHASGHASIPDLQRLVDAIAPARVVPIHSEAGDRFREFFPRVDRRSDGERWEV